MLDATFVKKYESPNNLEKSKRTCFKHLNLHQSTTYIFCFNRTMNLVVVVLQERLASFPVRWPHQVGCLEYLRPLKILPFLCEARLFVTFVRPGGRFAATPAGMLAATPGGMLPTPVGQLPLGHTSLPTSFITRRYSFRLQT